MAPPLTAVRGLKADYMGRVLSPAPGHKVLVGDSRTGTLAGAQEGTFQGGVVLTATF